MQISGRLLQVLGHHHLSSSMTVPGDGASVAQWLAILRSAGTILSRVRAPPPALWPDGGPESLRSPCCGLALDKNLTLMMP
ncbi:hypothetical protein PoB_000612700 [Plakobranchus ocellatus]|uniref:Uncharacterized protein n=1 Tax=Plakobranchus ocellatus TaxID=259542 RepID=A0AAV3Y9Z0_9GAST|nr:hypothetical protein PoB_000612700 [Plakobranchus ocellatus]